MKSVRDKLWQNPTQAQAREQITWDVWEEIWTEWHGLARYPYGEDAVISPIISELIRQTGAATPAMARSSASGIRFL